MLTPIAQKWLEVLVFLLTTEDSSLTTETGRTVRSHLPSNSSALETVKALFWVMISILVAFLTAHL